MAPHSIYNRKKRANFDIQELTEHNVTVCIVGKDEKFTEYNDGEVKQFLNLLDSCKKPAIRRQEEVIILFLERTPDYRNSLIIGYNL